MSNIRPCQTPIHTSTSKPTRVSQISQIGKWQRGVYCQNLNCPFLTHHATNLQVLNENQPKDRNSENVQCVSLQKTHPQSLVLSLYAHCPTLGHTGYCFMSFESDHTTPLTWIYTSPYMHHTFRDTAGTSVLSPAFNTSTFSPGILLFHLEQMKTCLSSEDHLYFNFWTGDPNN